MANAWRQWKTNLDKQRIGRLSQEVKELRRKNAVLTELVDSLTDDLELLEEMCGSSLVADAENVLQAWNLRGDTAQGPDLAIQELNESLRSIMFASHGTKELALQEAGVSLGRYCADNFLCPLATTLALYRVAMADSGISPESATESIIYSMRMGITERLREKGF